MKVGDEVEWVHAVRSGKNGLTASQRRGHIVEIDGDIAIIKKRNHHKVRIQLSRLHVVGSGPNQLTQLVDTLAGKN